MNGVLSTYAHPRFVPLAILLASSAVLISALAAQHLFGLEPCALCIYQRVPYVITAMVATVGVGLGGEGRAGGVVVGLCAVVFLTSAWLALYHVGVEQHWWSSIAACGTSGAPGDMTLEQLRTGLAAGKPPKPCDQVDWTLFGVSLAGFNALVSLGLAVFSLAGARAILRGKSP
ncbi:MAG: disulfide bond formation protein B [Rhodospirillales bacterium]|jgi:disulfide bond formation protein DsbB|nr:disulfide bond formation protein B [Rhodospirillales bacterium]HJO97373.1 disulfide bond formation protein B [Rhodospirillales bacterium]